MKKYLFPVVALVATMASCTSDVEDAAVSEQTGKAQKYVISAKPFENADDITRTVLTDGTSGITFEWGFNEKFGVYPIAPYANNQAKWDLIQDCPDDDHWAEFHKNPNCAEFCGQGWQLQDNVTYVAYQPYVETTNSYTEVPVEIPAEQGGTLAYIGSNVDWVFATGTYHDPIKDDHRRFESVIFDFNHAIAIVKIQVPVPNSGIDGVIVEAKSGNPFITEGTLDVSTGEVTATSTTNRITLNNYETLENGIATYYLAAFPTTTGECDIKVKTSGVTMNNTVSSKKLEAGKAYRWIL
jgi:hypothetical protein